MLHLQNQGKSMFIIRIAIRKASSILTRAHRLHVTFVDKEGEEHTFEVAKGDNLLDIAQANDLEMEGSLAAKPHTNISS